MINLDEEFVLGSNKRKTGAKPLLWQASWFIAEVGSFPTNSLTPCLNHHESVQSSLALHVMHVASNATSPIDSLVVIVLQPTYTARHVNPNAGSIRESFDRKLMETMKCMLTPSFYYSIQDCATRFNQVLIGSKIRTCYTES
jgi:hypothetical protein